MPAESADAIILALPTDPPITDAVGHVYYSALAAS